MSDNPVEVLPAARPERDRRRGAPPMDRIARVDRPMCVRSRARTSASRTIAALIAGLAVCLGAAAAQSETLTNLPDNLARQVDAEVDKHIVDNRLPGLAIGAWMPGTGYYLSARGVADLSTQEPRRLDQAFRIGSISKTMYATVVLQLADEGRLSVNDAISRWFPAFPNADAITVDDLLRMRSGIPDPWDGPMLGRYYREPLMALTAQDMIGRAAARTAGFKPPGTLTIYTNVNFVMLEKIIEVAGGAPAATLLADRIFRPLGMTGTFVPSGPTLPGGLHGYGWNAATGQYEDKTRLNPDPVGGAGAVVSTLSDLYAFAPALCAGTLLRPATQEARLRARPFDGTEADPNRPGPPFVRYGQGIGLFSRFCGHNGTIMGFSTEMFYLPRTGATIVINTNRLDEDDASTSSGLFVKLAKLLFPDDVDW